MDLSNIKSEITRVANTPLSAKLPVQYFICPYDTSHYVSKKNLEAHVRRCAAKYTDLNLTQFKSSKVEMQSYESRNGVFVFGVSIDEPPELTVAKRSKPKQNKPVKNRRYWQRQDDRNRRKNRRETDLNQIRHLDGLTAGHIKLESYGPNYGISGRPIKREASVETNWSTSTTDSERSLNSKRNNYKPRWNPPQG